MYMCVYMSTIPTKVKSPLSAICRSIYLSLLLPRYLGLKTFCITNLDPINFYVTFHSTDMYIS